MIKEIDIQTYLVDAANDLGGHAFKAAHRTKRGVLDLSVQLPGKAHCYIEVKFARKFIKTRATIRGPNNDAQAVHLELTPHQRKFIVDHSASGGCAGWCMVVALGNGRYAIDSSLRIPSEGVLYFDDHWLIKERGKPWPIDAIVQSLQR